MELYEFMKFLHILAAIVLLGSTAASHPITRMATRAPDIATLRPLGHLLGLISKVAPIAAILTLIPGLYLAFAGSWWSSGWVPVSLTLFVVAGAIAGAVIDKHAKALNAAVDAAADGPVTADVEAILSARVPVRFEWTLTGIDVAIVLLMVTKPGYVGAVTAGVVGVAAGALWGFLETRPRRRAAAAASATG